MTRDRGTTKPISPSPMIVGISPTSISTTGVLYAIASGSTNSDESVTYERTVSDCANKITAWKDRALDFEGIKLIMSTIWLFRGRGGPTIWERSPEAL